MNKLLIHIVYFLCPRTPTQTCMQKKERGGGAGNGEERGKNADILFSCPFFPRPRNMAQTKKVDPVTTQMLSGQAAPLSVTVIWPEARVDFGRVGPFSPSRFGCLHVCFVTQFPPRKLLILALQQV